MNVIQRIQQKPETQRRAMMLVTMFVVSGAIIYVWAHSLDLGGITQNPIEAVSQATNTKNEISPLQSLWIEAQIFGGQLRQIGAGLKSLAQGKIPEVPQESDVTKGTNVSNEPNVANDALKHPTALRSRMSGQENKKSFFGIMKDVITYNIGVLENILHF